MMLSNSPALVESFLLAKRLAGAAPATLRAYRQRVAHFVAWCGDQPLTRATIRAYSAHLAATHANPITINGYLQGVSVLCSWLVEEGELDANPAFRLKAKVPRRRPASYGRDQIRALLAVAGPRDRALVIVLLDTGLRLGELVQLQQASIDWASGQFHVVGKGNKERAGWLSPYALTTIQAYLTTRRDRNPALWMSQHGRRLSASGIHHAIGELAKRAGIRADVRRLVHSFRATFAKSYLCAGGDLESLRSLLGHSSLAMSSYYAQLDDDEVADKKRRVDPLANALGYGPGGA